jgi:hypothetical protein
MNIGLKINNNEISFSFAYFFKKKTQQNFVICLVVRKTFQIFPVTCEAVLTANVGSLR